VQQADVIRATGWLGAAAAGAGLALAGAAVTGHLGDTTTVQQIAAGTVAPTPSASTSGQRLSIADIYRLDSPGVVQITSARRRDAGSAAALGVRGQGALGSGFVIDKAGHIVTSNRVVTGVPSLHVRFSGNDDLDAILVGSDPATDVAVLQVDVHSRSLSPLSLGDSDAVQVGDQVVAIGNTMSLDRTATAGVVSALQRGVDAGGVAGAQHVIQTDAAIDSANAGGPLINSRGQVIGISSQLRPAGKGGFAVPINIVKSVVAQLLASGQVRHAYLGLDAVPVSASLARAFALPSSYGLLVENVTDGTAAARAGIRPGTTPVVVAGESYRIGGDIIVSADGKPISSVSDLRNVIQTKNPGDVLTLQLWRGAHRQAVEIRLGRPPG
jgi:S1-C subfamily serine protease